MRLSDDDLAFMADWCGHGYEGPEDDETTQRARRCAAWADAELARRHKARVDALVVQGVIEKVQERQGVTITAAQAKAAIKAANAKRKGVKA